MWWPLVTPLDSLKVCLSLLDCKLAIQMMMHRKFSVCILLGSEFVYKSAQAPLEILIHFQTVYLGGGGGGGGKFSPFVIVAVMVLISFMILANAGYPSNQFLVCSATTDLSYRLVDPYRISLNSLSVTHNYSLVPRLSGVSRIS